MSREHGVQDEETGVGFSVAPERGGELSSLRVRVNGAWRELLHRGGDFSPPTPGAWRGRAPWLFPAAGRSVVAGRPGFWRLGGVERAMPIHGFVKDREWDLLSASADAVTCRFLSDRDSRALYPFDFRLTAAYRLAGRGLTARLTVDASRSNAGPMPFSLGNHLTLALPLLPGGDARSCVVRSPASKIELLTSEGLLSGAVEPAPYAKGAALGADPRLFDLVLGGFPEGGCWAELEDPSAGLTARVSQREADGARRGETEHFRFVFYSDAGRSFFCVEPWYGRPDSLNDARGAILLPPGESFAWEMTVTLR